jgi:hypothetical protein
MNGTVIGPEKDKSRLNLGDAHYHSFQELLPFCLLLKNVKIKIYRTINLSDFCMNVKLSLTQK